MSNKLDAIAKRIKEDTRRAGGGTLTDVWFSRILTYYRYFSQYTINNKGEKVFVFRGVNPRRIILNASKDFERLPTPELKIVMWDYLTKPECEIGMAKMFVQKVRNEVYQLCKSFELDRVFSLSNDDEWGNDKQIILWAKEKMEK